MYLLPENVKFMLFFLLFSTLIIFHLQANSHEPVEFDNPSCIHLPYEKYM